MAVDIKQKQKEVKNLIKKQKLLIQKKENEINNPKADKNHRSKRKNSGKSEMTNNPEGKEESHVTPKKEEVR